MAGVIDTINLKLMPAQLKTKLEMIDLHVPRYLDLLHAEARPPQIQGHSGSLASETTAFGSVQAVKNHLANSERNNYRIRLISIFRQYSWAALDVDDEVIQCIASTYSVMPEFRHFLQSFREVSNAVEEGFTNSMWVSQVGDVLETSSVLKYAEQREGPNGKTLWSIRRVGLYEQFDICEKKGTFVVVFPNYSTGAYKDLETKLKGVSVADEFLSNPLALKVFMLQSRVNDWRAYISQFEEEVWEMANLALTVDVEDKIALRDTYTNLSRLNYLESRLAPLLSIFHEQQQLIHRLLQLQSELYKDGITLQSSSTKQSLFNLRARIDSYKVNVEFVLGKIRSTIQLISDTSNLKNQDLSENMSNFMLELNKVSIEDSTAMRMITFVTLLYLPPGFVSTFFGMGFFSTSDELGVHWTASPYIWIFVAVSAPLSLLTIGIWRWYLHRILRTRVLRAAMSEPGQP